MPTCAHLSKKIVVVTAVLAACSRRSRDERVVIAVTPLSYPSGHVRMLSDGGSSAAPLERNDAALEASAADAPERAHPAPKSHADTAGSLPLGPCHVVGKLSSVRHSMATIALPDGRVLFVGGGLHDATGDRAEIDAYDPVTDTVKPFAPLQRPRLGAGAAALSDGRVVVVGGGNTIADMSSAEVYEPARASFTLVSHVLRDPVRYPFVVPISATRVLIGGGEVASTFEASLQSAVFDVNALHVSTTRSVPWPISTSHNFHHTRSPKILVVQGSGPGTGWTSIKQGSWKTCEANFDTEHLNWDGSCWPMLDAASQVSPYPTLSAQPSPIGWDVGGKLFANRAGHWELRYVFQSGKAGAELFDGMALDDATIVASDAGTGDVLICRL